MFDQNQDWNPGFGSYFWNENRLFGPIHIKDDTWWFPGPRTIWDIRYSRLRFTCNNRIENFRTVDIEINALSSLFIIFKTIRLIFSFYHEKCEISVNSTNRVVHAKSEAANHKPGKFEI